MSTRSTTHFIDSSSQWREGKPEAIIYRHSDGYPEGAGLDLRRFLKECKALKDSRFGDPSYLAAKYVVFLADMFNQRLTKLPSGEYNYVRAESKLDFLSVGVMSEDPSDIEYRYVIDCGKIDAKSGLPELKCFRVSGMSKPQYEEVEIPRKVKKAS